MEARSLQSIAFSARPYKQVNMAKLGFGDSDCTGL